MKVLNWILLGVGHFILLRRHPVEHIDEADGVAETLRDLVVVAYYLGKLVFRQEFLDYAKVHLTLLDFNLETPG